MKKRDPIPVGDVLKALQKTTSLGKQLELAQVWERWGEIAGEALAAHGRPYTVKDGVLHVMADSTVWMHKYAYSKWRIVGRINRLAGRELVSDLFIRLASDDDPSDAPQTPKKR